MVLDRVFARDASVRLSAWRRATIVVMLGTALLLFSRTIVGELSRRTRNVNWRTPPDSKSLAADMEANTFFPDRMHGAIVMAIEAHPGTASVLTDAVAEFSRNVSQRVEQDDRVRKFHPITAGYYLHGPHDRLLPDALRKEFLSVDERMTLLLIQPTSMDGNFDDANALLTEFCTAAPPGYMLHITGMLEVAKGEGCFEGIHSKKNVGDMNFESLKRMELLTIPVALFIMSWLVTYVRLLLLPLFTLSVTFVVASLLTLPWMDLYPVPHDVPAAMGSVILALCMDYSLFFLSRFSEHQQAGWSLQRTVDTISRHTGETIAVSGALIAIAELSDFVFPEENLKGSGLCCGFAAIAAVVTNIAVTPALLLITGKFVVQTEFSDVFRVREVEMQKVLATDALDDHLGLPSALQEPLSHKRVRFMERHPAAVITAVFLLMSPILVSVTQLRFSADKFALLPMDVPAVRAMRRVQDMFPVGILDPYAIVITAPMPVLTQQELGAELRAGAGDLARHDLSLVAPKLGLSDEEATAIGGAAREIGRSVDPSMLSAAVRDLEEADCATLSGVGVGAVLSVQKASGASDHKVLRAVVRVADRAGCNASEVQRSVAGGLAALYADGGAPQDVAEFIQKEALAVGRSEDESIQIAAAAAEASHGQHVDPAILAAVQAGSRAVEQLHILNETVAEKVIHRDGDTKIDVLKEIANASRAVKHEHPWLQLLHEGNISDAQVTAAEEKVHMRLHNVASIFAAAASVVAKSPHVKKALSGAAKSVGNVSLSTASHDAGSIEHKATGLAGEQLPIVMDVIHAVAMLSSRDHGTLLLPSGYKAMLELCDVVRTVGSVSSMLGPTWGFHQPIDWATGVALHVHPPSRYLYGQLLQTHVRGHRALLDVHTTFPSVGAGGANWVSAVRSKLSVWEASHPGFTARLSGGASKASDTRDRVMGMMWSYLALCVTFIAPIVFFTYGSLMLPLRLCFALFLTLGATYGMAVIIYQTPLLHGIFPSLRYFDGVAFEIVPMVTGVVIALGLDYDIFLVSRIFEYRKQGFTDRASICQGSKKASGVISGAGVIMSLAFSGLVISTKLLFQQFGLLLIISVLFDTFVVRTVLVPASMLIAEDWNWWPRKMPPPFQYAVGGDGEVAGDGGTAYQSLAEY